MVWIRLDSEWYFTFKKDWFGCVWIVVWIEVLNVFVSNGLSELFPGTSSESKTSPRLYSKTTDWVPLGLRDR